MIVKTRVTEVSVFRNSATVIRNGEVELKEGLNTVLISGMTLTSAYDSYKLKFPEHVRANNIQIISGDMHDNEEGRESLLIQKKIDEITYKIETCDMMIDLRKKNGDFSARSNITVEEQEKIMQALPEQILELHKQRDELESEREKLKKKYEKQVAEETNPIIIADITAKEGGVVPFILQYQEKNSFWIPKYEIIYKDDKSPLSACYKAQIKQFSGEDWKQVKVTLYTGNPSVSSDLPELSPIELSIYEISKAKSSKASGAFMGRGAIMEGASMSGASAPDMMMAAPIEMNELKMDTATVSEEETMKAFLLPGLRDVLSDTDGNIAQLQEFTVKAEYHVLSIPSVDNKSYLTAEVVASDWPLPPAEASVYIRDTYAGTVYVNSDMDIDNITLSLGQDERITVIRTEEPKKTQDVFLKNIRKTTSKIVIKLMNNSSEAVNVLVKDQIPVSTDKTIVVEQINLSGGEADEKTGEVKYTCLAEPGNSITYELEYSVSWPKDKRINERRNMINSSKSLNFKSR